MDTLGSVSAISAKKDNVCDFLFAILQNKSLLKMDLH